MEVPKMAAMTMMPKMQAPMSFSEFANGPLSRTFPFELPTGPKLSEATEKKEKANQSRK